MHKLSDIGTDMEPAVALACIASLVICWVA